MKVVRSALRETFEMLGVMLGMVAVISIAAGPLVLIAVLELPLWTFIFALVWLIFVIFFALNLGEAWDSR